MDQVVIQTRSQANKSLRINEFNFDIASDLLRGITAKPKDDTLGKLITGKDSLHFSYELENDFDFSNFKNICKRLLESYYSESYKKNFAWIDNLRAVKDIEVKKRLNNKLIEQINTRNTEFIHKDASGNNFFNTIFNKGNYGEFLRIINLKNSVVTISY